MVIYHCIGSKGTVVETLEKAFEQHQPKDGELAILLTPSVRGGNPSDILECHDYLHYPSGPNPDDCIASVFHYLAGVSGRRQIEAVLLITSLDFYRRHLVENKARQKTIQSIRGLGK